MVRKHTTEELLGSQIDKLTLLKHYNKADGRGKSSHWWTCQCECGTVIERCERYLVSGKPMSCGCAWMTKMKGPACPLWRGAGEISAAYFAEIRMNAVYGDKEFTITLEGIWELFLRQDRKCALTGIPLTFSVGRKAYERHVQNASLDRIDSTKGYTPDNVWWVHKSVNRMKNAYSLEQFIWVCHEVARRFTQDDTVDLDKEVKSTSATKQKRKTKQKPADQLLAA